MHDICVIGAGIAGCSFAIKMARNGYKVAVIERNWELENGITGELLQPGGVLELIKLGLEDTLQDIDGQRINGYALNMNEDWLQIEYPFNQNSQAQFGYGFRYGKFIQNLRSKCLQDENVDCIQGDVVSFGELEGKVQRVNYRNQKGSTIQLDTLLTIVSPGSRKPVSKFLSNSKPQFVGFMLGLIIENCNLPFKGNGHVILANPSPILAYPVSKNKARVLIDFNKQDKKLSGEALKEHLLATVLPQMPIELQKGFHEAVLRGGYKTKPNIQFAARPVLRESTVLLGDSLNMRHPITGGGMTVALTDVRLLSDVLINSDFRNQPKALLKSLKVFYKSRSKQNSSLNILAMALYQVFRHNTLKIACFEYLKKGGRNSSEPMSLLSGLSRDRYKLIWHYIGIALFPFVNQKIFAKYNISFSKFIRSGLSSCKILLPLIWDEMTVIDKKSNQGTFVANATTKQKYGYTKKTYAESQGASA